MSEFLGVVPGEVIGLSSTPLDVHNKLKARLVDQGWQVVSEVTTGTPTKLFLIPPISESIGNAQCREIIGIECSGTAINIYPTLQALLPYPQILYFWPKTAGNVSAGATIGTTTITQDPSTLNAANTKEDNLRYFFEALVASTDPIISDFDWVYQYPPPQNADDPEHYIYGIRKTAVANLTVTPNDNINGGTLADFRAAGIQDSAITQLTIPEVISVDLINGFILFLQINKRGFALATRTNLGYYGPIHACYANHADALACLPSVGKFQKLLSPLELLVGSDLTSADIKSIARPAKWLGLMAKTMKINASTSDIYNSSHPFLRCSIRDVFMDFSYNNKYDKRVELSTSGLGLYKYNELSIDDFQLHKMIVNSFRQGDQYGSGTDSTSRVSVYFNTYRYDDWYKFVGTATDENLQFCADVSPITTLAQALDRTTAYTTIALVSTAAMPVKGMIVVEGEAIDYTSISGNTLQGCTRAKYATKAAAHANNTEVYLGHWFIKINGGALYCGYQRPA